MSICLSIFYLSVRSSVWLISLVQFMLLGGYQRMQLPCHSALVIILSATCRRCQPLLSVLDTREERMELTNGMLFHILNTPYSILMAILKETRAFALGFLQFLDVNVIYFSVPSTISPVSPALCSEHYNSKVMIGLKP